MRVLVALSGGVDSSVAAARLVAAGHDVVGATLKLWGGESDSGCCSVSDVDDARRVADALGIDHHTFAYAEEFEAAVVGPYVAAHARGATPNPCMACNRHLKFGSLLARADRLGFDAVATGHHARVAVGPDGRRRVARGADAAKDQSYVLHMLDQATLARTLFPIGGLTKDRVRAMAAELGLRTAHKPDSQDVCFITSAEGRAAFLGRRAALTPGVVRDRSGAEVGRVPAVELVTVGQRRGLGLPGGGPKRHVLRVEPAYARVTIGSADDLLVDRQVLGPVSWADRPVHGDLLAQCSAHGRAEPADVEAGPDGAVTLEWRSPRRRVAPGQAVVLYDGDTVLGSATITATRSPAEPRA
ncbi:MAG TPA: tRNA 2-thiouridine(34) synthase MnmA [Acidimicrobiales bacterium]|nr:tRNA 2-thiouridine(34) synthase MnmA [Acidimicrobiales bacterium]